ncbi:putative ribonuclease H-like domain-containing protein [Tanacetum coccineum]
MNQFCEKKGILRQYSVARTPQQNRVVERRNRTLIEAARTMLANSKLPTTFWAEAVNTACYVQNKVLIVKPHNKTPYELFHDRTPTLSFMRPFGCSVTILNTIDHLGKFDGKADKGLFVGYSLNSKAFRVFNSRTRIVKENLHIRFSKSTPNVIGTKASDNIGQARKETEPVKNYILLPLWSADPPYSQDPKSSQDDRSKPSSDDGNKVDENSRKDSEGIDQEKEDNVNSTNNVNVASTNEVNVVDDEDIGEKADMHNLNTTIQVSPSPTTRIHKDHPLDQVIGDLQSTTQTRRMIKNLEEHRFEEPKKVIHALKDPSWIEAMQEELLQFKLQEVWTLVLSLWEDPEEEVYVCQPPGFEYPDFPDRVYKVLKRLPKLGFWYPKDSPFDLVAYTDSDYAGASLIWKSKQQELIMLGKAKKSIRLMMEELCTNRQSDLVRKRIERVGINLLLLVKVNAPRHKLTLLVMVNAVEPKTVNGEVQLQALVDGKKIIITESTVRRDLQLEDAEGVDCLPNATIFEQLALMGYEQVSQKLTFYKAFFSPTMEIPYSYCFTILKSKNNCME